MTDVIRSFTGPHRFLSNFYTSPLQYDGITYKTAEHAYQAAKTFDLATRVDISRLGTPGEAKRFGKNIPIRPDWELPRSPRMQPVKVLVMEEIVTIKFTTHADLKAKLLATGDAYLEEENTRGDTFWGVCNGKGRNALGFCLMRVRDQLKGEIPDSSGFTVKRKRKRK